MRDYYNPLREALDEAQRKLERDIRACGFRYTHRPLAPLPKQPWRLYDPAADEYLNNLRRAHTFLDALNTRLNSDLEEIK